ncbi:MAG TPA: serine/threonine-protein kinase [Acidobacteriota bacterium]|nr:serine/threonine-protein kinase [Acidobacteriota bacterium]
MPHSSQPTPRPDDDSQETRIDPPADEVTRIDGSDGVTRAGRPSRTDLSTTSSGSRRGEFPPGVLLAGRYRIVGLLGKGGMGEVYRAEDLTLDQEVALKFLPRDLASDDRRLARFLDEVRVARRVSHPNVCRVHDVGEAEGRHFISMEYIDGEDLSSLLRRIGRLPEGKALELSRQMCAGLAAAHEAGVLHRDFKPANIMIDGLGRVRIADFGLAAAARDVAQGDVSGTPAYMAPEQLEGREVSQRSDVFALGLVLYEMFTGSRALQARSLAELRQLHESSQIAAPSSVLDGIDPAIERAILRCLQSDPQLRPASAPAVSAALPGGSPLAQAMAAGETPSPELVAASGGSGVLSTLQAWLVLGGVLVGLAASVWLLDQVQLFRQIPLDLSPEVLSDRARQHLANLGYDQRQEYSARGFGSYNPVVNRFSQIVSEDYKQHGFPPARLFWYRESPFSLLPGDRLSYRTGLFDPPATTPGMVMVLLDPKARLFWLDAVPPRLAAQTEAPPFDWSLAFAAAGFNWEDFLPAEPRLNPPVNVDQHLRWTGTSPFGSQEEISVEAASFQGQLVFFRVQGPWNESSEETASSGPSSRFRRTLLLIFTTFLNLGAIVGCAFLVRHNLKLGRGDRQGALRIALCIFIGRFLASMLIADHTSNINAEWGLMVSAASIALLTAALSWFIYIGIEPFARRYWPHSLISWNRLLRGRLRDSLVGRDLLLGCLIATFAVALALLSEPVEQWMGYSGAGFRRINPAQFEGGRVLAGYALQGLISAFPQALLIFLVLVLARGVLKRDWLASLPVIVIFTFVLAPPAGDGYWIDLVFKLAVISIAVMTLIRLGLLSVFAASLTSSLLLNLPTSLEWTSWYGPYSAVGPLGVLALALWGFHLAWKGPGSPQPAEQPA